MIDGLLQVMSATEGLGRGWQTRYFELVEVNKETSLLRYRRAKYDHHESSTIIELKGIMMRIIEDVLYMVGLMMTCSNPSRDMCVRILYNALLRPPPPSSALLRASLARTKTTPDRLFEMKCDPMNSTYPMHAWKVS